MTTPSSRNAGLLTDFYAPEFVVEVENRPLSPESHADVREIKVELDLKDLASADLKLNNYDDQKFDLKYVDDRAFQIGNRVHVKLGYAERTVSVLRGYVITLAPDFPEDGSPTLTVRALDSLVKLKNSKPPSDGVTFPRTTDAQIAKRLAQRHGLRCQTSDGGPVHELVTQRNVDDAVFLKERAALIDWQAYMEFDPRSGQDTLKFVTPADGRGADPVRTYVLAWGWLRNADVSPSLISFKPTITAGDQVQSVEVRGWDPDTKQAIVQKATPDNTPGVKQAGQISGPDAAALIGGGEGRREVVVDRPVANADEALALARALLANRSYEFLTAHGRTIGLPDLRPGDNVEIHGVGAPFSTTYFVTHVSHVLNDKGFFTDFDARR